MVAFVGAEDIPGENQINLCGGDAEIFASKRTEYLHQPLGLVVASSPQAARQAASMVDVQYICKAVRSLAPPLAIFSNEEGRLCGRKVYANSTAMHPTLSLRFGTKEKSVSKSGIHSLLLSSLHANFANYCRPVRLKGRIICLLTIH